MAKIASASSAVCGWLQSVFGLGGSGLELEVGVWFIVEQHYCLKGHACNVLY